MYLRRSAFVKYFVAALVGAVLYCEWLVYLIQPRYWHSLECGSDDTTCTKILFIADPQIQGDMAVSPPLSYLFNWDSDLYLKSTFSVVMQYFKPDMLVYLGDLMDEGSISTMVQFHGYVKRLSNIFDIDYPIVQVWLPGDNDIGGENEPIKRDKVAEFERVFEQPSVITYRNISFYKVNGITHSFPQMSDGKEDSNFRIVVSHYPITSRHVFSKQVNDEIKPSIYFCAHDHESKYVTQNSDLTHRSSRPIAFGDQVLSVAFDEHVLYEVYVPTCSYRMGTSKIGYGAAILENSGRHMKYTVFWSPKRFPSLFFYLAVLLVLILYVLTFCIARLVIVRSKFMTKSDDRSPLLERI